MKLSIEYSIENYPGLGKVYYAVTKVNGEVWEYGLYAGNKSFDDFKKQAELELNKQAELEFNRIKQRI